MLQIREWAMQVGVQAQRHGLATFECEVERVREERSVYALTAQFFDLGTRDEHFDYTF